MIILTVAKGPDRGTAFEVRGKTRAIIGRNSPDVPVTDLMVSRYHCRLKFDGGQWYVKDLGSRNGTRVNGERIQKTTLLRTGDLIATGYTELQVKLVPDESTAQAPAAADAEPASEEQLAADSAQAMDSLETEDDSLTIESQNETPEADDDAPRPALDSAAIEPVKAAEMESQSAGQEDDKLEAAAVDQATPSENELKSTNGSPKTNAGRPQIAPASKSPAAKTSKDGEEAASEWFSAVESQLVVAEEQGWESELIVEDAKELRKANKDVVDVDERVREVLYYDDDEHWEDVDGDELPPHKDVEVRELSCDELAKLLDAEDPDRAEDSNSDEPVEQAATVGSATGAGSNGANGSKRRRKPKRRKR